MSDSERWRKFLNAFSRKSSNIKSKDPRLEELVGIVRRGKTKGSERLEPSSVLMRRSELLYRLEPLIFSGINKLTRRITASKVFFSGPNEDENTSALTFFEDSGAKTLMKELVKDAFIYGFGAAEINKTKNLSTLTQIDPKEFDYIRDGNEIALQEDGTIKGFKWSKKGVGMDEATLNPDEVLLIRFHTLGEYSLGVSPVEAAFKTAWIKLNLEEALGEAIFRHGFPKIKYHVGTKEPGPWHEVTVEKIKQAKKIVKEMDTATDLVLPWWMDAIPLETGTTGDVSSFLELLSMEILAALELPKAFGIETRGLGGRAVEELDFEKTILAFQQSLIEQIEEQFLFPYFKLKRFKTRPRLCFTEYAPELQNIKLRRLSAYAKHGLITRTDELENELRKAEGFPLKIKKREEKENNTCIFNLGKCSIREEEDMPLDKLAAFCNICVKRLKVEKKIKGQKVSESQ